jgi:adenine specific DNA methylase Mod
MTNKLFYGDCLGVMKTLPEECCDLIYLDPPFNSNATYNLLFASPTGDQARAQIEAFDDTWHWGEQSAREYKDIQKTAPTDVSNMLVALVAFLGTNDVTAYLTMMTSRLLEIKRLMKDTASIYLHCDPSASHYLKVILDGIFGAENFRNEIIWKRTTAKSLMTRRMPSNHDIIFYYSKTPNYTFNQEALYIPYDEDKLPETTKSKYSNRDPDGRRYTLGDLTNPNTNRPNLTYEFLGITKVWRWTKERMKEAYESGIIVQSKPGAVPRVKRYLDEQKGIPIDDVWTDVNPLNSQAQERLGYPTQKPLALLDRIILASTNEDDIVLDPFCGCGTAVHSAQKNRRKWMGIDITHLAVSLIERRLRDAFPECKFETLGTPKDFESASDLSNRDKYQFQWWALSLIDAQPYKDKKKGADGGIDGQIFFDDGSLKKILVSVKGGMNVSVSMIRDLIGTIKNNKADIGIFLTLAKPTKPMIVEALNAGFYESEYYSNKEYPRIQILTIEGLMNGTERAVYPDLTQGVYNFKKAQKETDAPTQQILGI